MEPDKEGNYVIGDMTLTKSQIKKYFGLTNIKKGFRSSGIVGEASRWPDGIMPFKIHYTFNQRERRKIYGAIREFNAEMKGCIKLV